MFFFLLILPELSPARGELVLANFNAANPIKVMAIGDSITDDCAVNGAWRLYLQSLLDTNGYPFTFVGRNSSTPTAGFTKLQHEGYCGAVVAPPGVLSSPVHGYAGADVDLQKIVPDAFTNGVIPDLVLVLIGANDIGRGRNPFQVATNDMLNLLNVLYSNAPNADIILAKITTLQNAIAGGTLNYGAYNSNVATYNGVLQTMVNQQRALGKNVSLADMFSVVDFNTMFMGDHLHPNALGLQTIAREWFARIQAITVTTGSVTTTLIHGGADWNYNDQGQDLGTNWVRIDYDDGGWSNGPARLGFGDLADATTISYGASKTNLNTTAYFRRTFVVPDNIIVTNLNFHLTRVDGAIVWLNGLEAFRSNMITGPIGYTNLAPRATIGDGAHIFYPTNLPATNLTAGTNLVAVELHPSTLSRTSGGFDLELIGTGYAVFPPSITITRSGADVLLSWPVAGATGYTLHSTTNLAGSWPITTASIQTNGDQIIATLPPAEAKEFFRLQKP